MTLFFVIAPLLIIVTQLFCISRESELDKAIIYQMSINGKYDDLVKRRDIYIKISRICLLISIFLLMFILIYEWS